MVELKYAALENILQSLLQLRNELNIKIKDYPLSDKLKVKRSFLYSSVRFLIEKILHDIDTQIPEDINYSDYQSEFITLFRMYDEGGSDGTIEDSYNSLRNAYKNLKRLLLNDPE